MKKTHRSGVDIQVAFRSAMKRASSGDALSGGPESTAHAAAPQNGETVPGNTVSAAISLRARTKAFSRKVAQSGYRLLKPMLRPLALRARRYFTEELHQDLRREIQRASAATAQELQSALQQAIQSAPTVQELRSVIREEVQSAAAKQELRSAATVRELRSVIRQEIRDEALLPRLDRIEQYSCATARRVAINCGPNEVLVKTEAGFVICAAADYALLACLVDTGDLELGTRLLIQKFLEPGDMYVDVGANIGMHVLAAARAMEGRGKIVGFEPFEPTERMLEKTVWMNGLSDLVEVHQAAVSNVTGRQKLFLGPSSGHHSLFALDTPGSFAQIPVDVPVVRLDDAIGPDRKIDLLKIDVEGAELEVLEGGASLIAGTPDIALIVEFGNAHLRRAGHTPEQWMEAFARLGLHYRVIDAYSGQLQEWPVERLSQVESANLFFARDGSRAWGRLSA